MVRRINLVRIHGEIKEKLLMSRTRKKKVLFRDKDEEEMWPAQLRKF